MADIASIVAEMRAGKQIRFSDLFKVCEHYFGKPRNRGSSHYIFKMPWPGNPRVNIQDDGGKAKHYQIRQVLAAIDKLAAAPKPAKSDKEKPKK